MAEVEPQLLLPKPQSATKLKLPSAPKLPQNAAKQKIIGIAQPSGLNPPQPRASCRKITAAADLEEKILVLVRESC